MSLSGNTEKINELISKINALPEAGSGGGSGGGVETCTVTVSSKNAISRLYATVYTGGAFDVFEGSDAEDSYTVDNVVNGSVIVFRSGSSSVSLENATLLGSVLQDELSMTYAYAAVAG